MTIQHIIESSFDATVNILFKPNPRVVKFILNHERKKLCIENLVTEVRKMQLQNATTCKKKDLIMLGVEFARTFSDLAIKHEHQDKMHYLEKQKLADEQKALDEIITMFDSVDSSEEYDGNKV